jgi:hypothetical protein
MAMNRRRFMFLAVTLVTLNTFFWLASGGLALSKSVINRFFGPSMVRAEVLVQSAGVVQDWRIDRGVITAVAGTSLTLRESDATTVTITVDPNAKVQGPGRFSTVASLRKRLRVVVYHQANLPADFVQVEGVGG